MKNLLIFITLIIYQISFSQTEIFQSVRDNDIEKLSAFIKNKGNINISNQKGHSLLTLACYNNAFESVVLLLKNKAETNLKDDTGNTALMGASFKGYPKITKLLLENGADPNVLNFNKANALFFAVTFGNVEIASQLIAYKTNLQQKDRFEKTIFDYALIQDNKEMINLLKIN